MSRGDGTGPIGYGPKTGQGAGFCAGDPQTDYTSRLRRPGFGYGFGRMRGSEGGMSRGRRTRWGGFFAQPTPKDERSFLENQREALQSRLNGIDQSIEELSAQESSKS